MDSAFLYSWLALFLVHLTVTIVPGPAFVMCLRNSLKYSRKTGVMTAIGLGLGLMPHVLFTIFGVAALVHHSVLAFSIIKYAGAAYLIYIGWKALFSKEDASRLHIADMDSGAQDLSARKALTQGILTNVLNPKATLFYVAIFAQFITPETLPYQKALYGVTALVVEAGWFSVVAVILTNPKIKAGFSKFIVWIDRLCGGLFIGLGARLATVQASVTP